LLTGRAPQSSRRFRLRHRGQPVAHAGSIQDLARQGETGHHLEETPAHFLIGAGSQHQGESRVIARRIRLTSFDYRPEPRRPLVVLDVQCCDACLVFYEVRPGWTDQVAAGDIVIAGRNFGVGSSRPVSGLFRQLRVAGLIAEEFNSLFLRNAINAGLPALTAPGVTRLFRDGDHGTFDIATGVYRNDTTGAIGEAAPLPPLLVEIIASGGILPRLAAQGYIPERVDGAAAQPTTGP
jgi:3-isopropylmalate/(R)-2-methylmalate dehydratase small subunit